MKKYFVTWSSMLWSAVLLVVLSNTVFAKDCPTDIKAVTDTDVQQ
jgi:hypothetical protein